MSHVPCPGVGSFLALDVAYLDILVGFLASDLACLAAQQSAKVGRGADGEAKVSTRAAVFVYSLERSEVATMTLSVWCRTAHVLVAHIFHLFEACVSIKYTTQLWFQRLCMIS